MVYVVEVMNTLKKKEYYILQLVALQLFLFALSISCLDAYHAWLESIGKPYPDTASYIKITSPKLERLIKKAKLVQIV